MKQIYIISLCSLAFVSILWLTGCSIDEPKQHIIGDEAVTETIRGLLLVLGNDDSEIVRATITALANTGDPRIEELMEKFAGTKLTTSERRQFESLKEHLTTLERIETKYRENSINNKTHVIPEIFKHIKNDLNDLAETQILESKSKMFLAQKSLNTTNLLSNLELGLLIIVGIAIQFVIFYRIKKTSYGSNLKTVN